MTPSPRQPVGYHDLLADLRHAGCPVCRGAARAAWRYIDSVLWESVTDPGTRRHLRRTHGLCREHALMALDVSFEQSGAHGLAVVYEDLLKHVRQDAVEVVAQHRGAKRRARKAPRDLTPEAPCPACGSAEQVAENYLLVLGSAEAGSEVARAARGSLRGLCVPHLDLGLRHAPSADITERLLDLYLHGEEELRGYLTEFIRKQDYRYRGEGITKHEGSSWTRAVYRLVGSPRPRKEPKR